MNRRKRAYSMELRAAKAEATKTRIRQAAVALHAERLFEDFTLDEIALRAGTTVQTVLRIFGSKEALTVLLMEAASERQRQYSPPGDIAAAVRALYDDYEAIGDQVIWYLAEELRRPALARHVEIGRQEHRRWVEMVFAPQLQRRSGRARTRLLHALIVATDVYAWKLLRRDLKLERPAAESVVGAMIAAIVKGGADGEIHVGLLGRGRKPAAEPGHRPRPQPTRS